MKRAKVVAVAKVQQATDCWNISCSNKALHMCRRFSFVVKRRMWRDASADVQWWLGCEGRPQEAENDDVEAECEDMSFSRYGVGW